MRLTLNSKQNNISNILKHGESKIISGFNTWIETNKSRKLDKINNFLIKRAELIDVVLTSTWKDLELSKQKDIALFAVGGYGRRELHPHSDIDLLLLSKKTLNKSQTQLIENFISFLWDLGLEIGHSVRNIKESRYFAKKDQKSKKDQSLASNTESQPKEFKLEELKGGSKWSNLKPPNANASASSTTEKIQITKDQVRD